MKAVYVGAGIDTRPLIDLSNKVKIFHYIDSLPFSLYGIRSKYNEHNKNIYSRPNFIPKLDDKLNKIGFQLTSETDHLRIYIHNDIILFYHINTSIPEHIHLISNHIHNYDILIVAGHHPHMNIIFPTQKKIHLIGYYGTSFHNPLEENETIIYEYDIIEELYKNTINTSFQKYTYIDNKLIHHTFDTWNEFIQFYYSLK